MENTKTPAPGDILCSVWGQTMSIVEFCIVQSVSERTMIGKKVAVLTVAPMTSKETEDGYLCGTCVPDAPVLDVPKSRLTYRGNGFRGSYVTDAGQKLSNFISFFPWNGKPVRYNYCD